MIKILLLLSMSALTLSFSKNSASIPPNQAIHAHLAANELSIIFTDFYTAIHDAEIIIQQHNPPAQPVVPPVTNLGRISTSGYFITDVNLITNGSLSVNGNSINYDQVNKAFNQEDVVLFDQSNTITLTDQSPSVLFNVDLDVPKPLAINYIDSGRLSIGSTITYNADQSNEFGLACIVSFLSSHPANSQFSELDRVNAKHIVDDNGSFVIDETLLEGIPDDAYVDLILVRGNVSTAQVGSDIIGIQAQTTSSQMIYVEKQ